MTTFYEDMQATAAELVAEFGAPMTLSRPTGAQDPVTGGVTGAGATTIATTGLFLSRTTATVRESLAEGAERMALIDASQVPAMNDRLVFGGVTFAIVRIDEINPAGTPLAYVLHVSK